MTFMWASRQKATSDTFTVMSRCACFESLRKRSETGAVYGEAQRLEVSIARSADYIELTVTDDGRGFDLEAVRRDGNGLGLVSMEERAHVVGGDLQIITRPGQGTTIRVRIPAGAYQGAEKGHVHEAVRQLAAYAPQRSNEPFAS
jgi:signal transduction histidine kinase